MGKYFLILICFFILTADGVAQYEKDRERFNYKDYVRSPVDQYRPIYAGVLAAMFPGLGHVYCNERARGVKVFKRFAGSFLVSATGLVLILASESVNLGYGFMLGGAFLMVGNQIWSIVDASRVAKVKNMAIKSRPRVGL